MLIIFEQFEHSQELLINSQEGRACRLEAKNADHWDLLWKLSFFNWSAPILLEHSQSSYINFSLKFHKTFLYYFWLKLKMFLFGLVGLYQRLVWTSGWIFVMLQCPLHFCFYCQISSIDIDLFLRCLCSQPFLTKVIIIPETVNRCQKFWKVCE